MILASIPAKVQPVVLLGRRDSQNWKTINGIPLNNMEHLLGSALVIIAVPFVLMTIFVATRKGGYYDTDQYKGNGTAH